MKRMLLPVIVLLIAAVAVSSCQKCTVCTASDLTGDHVSEYCGSELDVRDYEKFFLDSVAGISVAGYCERGPDN